MSKDVAFLFYVIICYMRSDLTEKFKKFAIIFLMLAAFGFYTTSILTMQSGDKMVDTCAVVSTQGSQSQSPDACVSYHLGLLHNLSEAPFSGLIAQLLVLSLFVLTFFTLFSLFIHLKLYFSRLQNRYKELTEKTLAVFYTQLGFWLVLFQKRDPAYAYMTT
jgi:hypothetical protein